MFRSENGGKSWSVISDVPAGKAKVLTAHPFSDRRVFILTDEKQHYYSEDGGLSWTSFSTPVVPSTSLSPLEFNAHNPGYIIFVGKVCSNDFFGLVETCKNEVSQ